ncbi:MAG: DUF177 domain-containing protein [Nitratireductor sp.]|nr:DUF177 domain-containing protein [Nitratireductor sp.]
MSRQPPSNEPGRPRWPVTVTVLPARGFAIAVEADAAERAYLADQAGALSLERFNADLLFQSWRREGVKVVGRIRADLTQSCVVTLDPVEAAIDQAFEQTFVPEGSKLARPRFDDEGEMILDPDGPDLPDLFTGDVIDAWDVLIEQFLLAVDPFPRAQGAALEPYASAGGEGEEPQPPSPFAVLARLKKDQDG